MEYSKQFRMLHMLLNNGLHVLLQIVKEEKPGPNWEFDPYNYMHKIYKPLLTVVQ